MPRFSETEKKNIREKLITEGEKLFLAYGIKKVTIDDLVKAVHIAKASFYVFYENKEYLFLDIVQYRQQQVFTALDSVLADNINLSNKERVRQVFFVMHESLSQYPILSQVDTPTVELVARKVPKERLVVFAEQNIDAAKTLQNHGVKFSCKIETASYAFQALYHSWMFLGESNAGQQEAVIKIMLDGIINQIVI